MQREDFQNLATISHALWADASASSTATHDTIGAISLLNLPEQRAADRAALVLLDRIRREGPSSNLQALNHPFYRLHPEERFILTALHFNHWSYNRIAEILGEKPETVEMTAWQARLLLASMNPQRGGKPLFFPAGTDRGPNCPDYDIKAPWTQRFLDNELDSQRKVFFQNHLMNCHSCKQSLNLCREAYYTAEGLLPELRNSPFIENMAKSAEGRYKKLANRARFSPVSTNEISLWDNFQESLRIFFNRQDIKYGFTAAVITLIALKLLT